MMVLFLEVISGPLQGRKFRAEPGLRIGRREGEILLEDDPKVSGFHAQIELDNKGQPVLMDQGSANGLVINGRKVKKVAMLPGVTFRVGDTPMIVIEVAPEVADAYRPPKSWLEQLQEYLKGDTGEQTPRELLTFTPPVVLDFVQGIQTDQSMVLGYGPRTAGAGDVDIDLHDPEAPPAAFEVLPGPGAALLRDLTGGKILLNRESLKEDMTLQEGDEISLGGTLIKVRYL